MSDIDRLAGTVRLGLTDFPDLRCNAALDELAALARETTKLEGWCLDWRERAEAAEGDRDRLQARVAELEAEPMPEERAHAAILQEMAGGIVDDPALHRVIRANGHGWVEIQAEYLERLLARAALAADRTEEPPAWETLHDGVFDAIDRAKERNRRDRTEEGEA